jgi:hypothetical protein
MITEAASVIIFFLIPKGKGGTRPIGLFSTLVRTWEAIRIPEARSWARINDRAYNYAGPGSSAERAAFAQLVYSEAAVGGTGEGSTHSGTVLADLAKAYERVRFDVAFRSAARLGWDTCWASWIAWCGGSLRDSPGASLSSGIGSWAQPWKSVNQQTFGRGLTCIVVKRNRELGPTVEVG